jgi:hypothetical protein
VVAHAGGVAEEVAEFPFGLVLRDALEGILADGGLDAVDVAVVEVFQAGGKPGVLVVAQHELQGPGKAVEVLAGVVEVDDLGGLGDLLVAMPQIQAAPSPMMVSWRTWPAPRRMPSAFTRSANTGAGSKAAMMLADARSRTG